MAIHYYSSKPDDEALPLLRRGFHYGWIKTEDTAIIPNSKIIRQAWLNNEAIFLPGILADNLITYSAETIQAHRLFEQILDGAELSEILEAGPYGDRLAEEFALSGASFEDNDEQGIEKIIFDAWDEDDIIAENLWCKVSWLSFDEDDGSLRFRFSFGFEGYEDVASDPQRQYWAAKLTEVIFPESAAVTKHQALGGILSAMLESKSVEFMERIVYFNAPNGGAQMHHDVERGHDGVVFAQMTGSTFWLALSKPKLVDEIERFLALAPAEEWAQLRQLAVDRNQLVAYLEEPDHELAEQLIDHEPKFFQQLIESGYAHVLNPGDVLLMPQSSLNTCVWHSVICLGDEPGEGLSFALKNGSV
jgi:hypothetical protein